jgi:hypothetical protein
MNKRLFIFCFCCVCCSLSPKTNAAELKNTCTAVSQASKEILKLEQGMVLGHA